MSARGTTRRNLASPPAIRLAGVTVRAGGRILLHELDLSIAQGEKVVLWGPSGSGKSTLLKTIVGGMPCWEGEVWVGGERLAPRTVAAIRRRLAYIPQEPFAGAGTVEEALLFPFQFKARRHQRPPRERLEAELETLGMPAAFLTAPCASLSGGERQRLAVARALLLDADIVLADEITSALDPANRERVLAALMDRPHTVLAVAHDPAWRQRADRTVRLENGKLHGETMRA